MNVVTGSRLSSQEPRRQPAEDADAGAEQEADQGGDADERERPRQRLGDHLADRGREEGEGEPEVAVERGATSSRCTAAQSDWFSSRPNSAFSEAMALVSSWPWKRAHAGPATGSPGIRRGIRKLMVIAAHAVTV